MATSISDFSENGASPQDTPSADEDLWQRAAVMAAKAHAGSCSPGTKDPYIAHVARVAQLVSATFGHHDPAILAASYLHDVLEKTPLESQRLAEAFGTEVTEWVEWLSKNRKGPQDEYWQRLPAAPWQARLIKLADAMDHLNGPQRDREARLKTAHKALKLVAGEPELTRAEAALRRAIDQYAQIKVPVADSRAWMKRSNARSPARSAKPLTKAETRTKWQLLYPPCPRSQAGKGGRFLA